MLAPLFLSLPIAIATYLKDESLTGYLPDDGPWVLEEVNGEPASAPVALTFTRGGLQVSGDCLTLSAAQTAPYPWFEATGIDAAAAEDCPAPEAAFADRLSRVVVAEAAGDVLILSDADTLEMVFRLRPEGG